MRQSLKDIYKSNIEASRRHKQNSFILEWVENIQTEVSYAEIRYQSKYIKIYLFLKISQMFLI